MHVEAATEVGTLLANEGIGIVYGGASIGVMGALADAALAAGGEVIGVIPYALQRREAAHPGVTEMHHVETMHQRKALMGSLSDAFLALPGGLGTLEELFEVLTWNQLGIHAKPCGLLNVAGYYGALLDFLDQAATSGFVSPQHREMLLSGDTASAVVAELGRRAADPAVDAIIW